MWPLGGLAGLALLLPVAAPFAAERNAEDLAPMGPGLVPRWWRAASWPWARCGVVARPRGRVRRAARARGGWRPGLVVFLLVLPRSTPSSRRARFADLRGAQGPGEPYAIYPRLDAPVIFYTERFSVPLESEAELRRFVARPGRKWLLIERDDLASSSRGSPCSRSPATRTATTATS